MTPDYFVELYDYNYWANRRVWNCVEQLSDEQFKHDLGYSRGSIHVQCFHMMFVEQMWFRHLATGTLLILEESDFLTRESIWSKWYGVEREVCAYVENLTSGELEREVPHPMAKPGDHMCKVWEALMQTALHSLDHRAQVLAGLHQLGAPTVEQGFLPYVYEKRGYSS